jgi:hypothetical protein
MQDRYASVVSLARAMLMDAHPSNETCTVRTASLRLVLETLVGLGSALPSPLPAARPSPSAQAVAEGARRTVAGHIAAVDLEVNPSEGLPRGRL